MELNRRALYNLIRMNWLNEPTPEVESWQVEDYREMSTEEIFDQLSELGLSLDTTSFYALSGPVDTPEELTEELVEEMELHAGGEDRVYLLIFELWRRLIPEKQCLTIFCDELDHQIFLYDRGDLDNDEQIQDVIAHLQMILDENTDKGENPKVVFQSICYGCANDVESFLYDFIAMQIDDGNDLYASELVEGFDEYVEGSKWFDILRLRLLADSDEEAATEGLKSVVNKVTKSEDLQYNLEVLTLVAQIGDRKEFKKIVKKTIPLLEMQRDLKDLLVVCSDYYRYHDLDEQESEIRTLLHSRTVSNGTEMLDQNDPNLSELKKIISK